MVSDVTTVRVRKDTSEALARRAKYGETKELVIRRLLGLEPEAGAVEA